MSGWRRIVVAGVEYTWRCGAALVVVRKDGRVVAKLTLEEITGLSVETVKRGRHKRTSDGMIRPGQVTAAIARLVPPAPRRA